MYKVFINDKPIIFTNSIEIEGNFPVYTYKRVVIEELFYRFKVGDLKGVFLFSIDINTDWKHFLSQFRVITAGGGLVLNAQNDILFIYRNNKWDLPKGRIEKGESIEETAIREVEEECGISSLEIRKFLLKTYHIFFWNSEARIKETYWYLMHSDFKGQLTPQLEEGITRVIFKSENEIPDVFKNTYANIKLVIDTYKNDRLS